MITTIDSNGYLYQLNGLSADYVVIYDNGDISNYGAFGQYHAGNPRCSYDENYLLSCATTSADGTLVPVTFSYNQYFSWLGLYAPSGIPTMNLYVEFAVLSTPSTTSSSSSTTSSSSSTTSSSSSTTCSLAASATSFVASSVSSCLVACSDDSQCAGVSYNDDTGTCQFYLEIDTCPIASRAPSVSVSSSSSSTASATGSSTRSTGITGGAGNSTSSVSATASPTVPPTCTLIPRLPNGGFEDGKNQTAWTTIGGSYSSWAPTTTNPLDGALSGQFTFAINNNADIASVRLVNTLSNLCPGSRYTISYRSYCDVPFPRDCLVQMATSESTESEEYSSTTYPDEDVSDNDDIFEFTAASSTTTLYVYVGTMTDKQSVGNIYLDDFSIALLESQDTEDITQKKTPL
ncbi:hypothetical protein KCU77_g14777, partial [Aureobasidium melanogenum]